jgi:hypothetical protein
MQRRHPVRGPLRIVAVMHSTTFFDTNLAHMRARNRWRPVLKLATSRPGSRCAPQAKNRSKTASWRYCQASHSMTATASSSARRPPAPASAASELGRKPHSRKWAHLRSLSRCSPSDHRSHLPRMTLCIQSNRNQRCFHPMRRNCTCNYYRDSSARFRCSK